LLSHAGIENRFPRSEMAQESYRYADEMLIARHGDSGLVDESKGFHALAEWDKKDLEDNGS